MFKKDEILERITDEGKGYLLQSHAVRYRFVLPYLEGKDVLEVGCGTCYGMGKMLTGLKSIVGIDISLDALRYGQLAYPENRLKAVQADCEALPFPDKSFDAVISFEVMEHLPDSKKYLSEISRVMQDGGYLFLSTPNKRFLEYNPYHLKEYTAEDLKEALHSVFSEVSILGQACSKKSRAIYKTGAYRLFARVKAAMHIGPVFPASLKRWIEKCLTGTTSEDVEELDFVISGEDAESASNFLALCRKT